MRPHRQQPTRLLRPRDSPGKSIGVGCHFLLQCIKVKSESEVTQSCLTLRDPMDCSPPGSSVHGIFQERVLEWGSIAFTETEQLEDSYSNYFSSNKANDFSHRLLKKPYFCFVKISILYWSSGFPYFLQFKSEFGNKEFMIWVTVSSRSCFC